MKHPVQMTSVHRRGFSLLEVLVSLALLGIAMTVILQLFSANLRALSSSEDYVTATLLAEAKMREVLDNDELTEKSWSELTDDGYRINVTVSNTLKERTEDFPFNILAVEMTLSILFLKRATRPTRPIPAPVITQGG